MTTVFDLPNRANVIKDFVEAEGSVFVSQKTVPEKIAKMRRCLVKRVVFSDFTMIPSGLDTTAIAEYMYQSLNE